MGRYQDKYERKAQAAFDRAIENAQAVTQEEYAEAVADALNEEGFNTSAQEIMDSAPVENWEQEVENLDVSDFDLDWSEIAQDWHDNWGRAYGLSG